jgi:hypothetical protein
MSTSLFDLRAIDRIETDVINIGKDVARMATAAAVELGAIKLDQANQDRQLMTLADSLAALTKTVTDFIAAVSNPPPPQAETGDLNLPSATIQE